MDVGDQCKCGGSLVQEVGDDSCECFRGVICRSCQMIKLVCTKCRFKSGMTFEDAIQLHEELRVIYVVDGYMAYYEKLDGQIKSLEAKGSSVREAIDNLEMLLSKTPNDTRKQIP